MRHEAAKFGPGRVPCLARIVIVLGTAGAAMAAAAAAPRDAAMQRGWQTFQTRCAVCHGPGATGQRNAPDLLARVAGMDRKAFSTAVLNGHARLLQAGETAPEGSPERRAWLAEVQRRAEGKLAMPDWSDDAEIKVRIADLYGYLRARADGSLDARAPRPTVHGTPLHP